MGSFQRQAAAMNVSPEASAVSADARPPQDSRFVKTVSLVDKQYEHGRWLVKKRGRKVYSTSKGRDGAGFEERRIERT